MRLTTDAFLSEEEFLARRLILLHPHLRGYRHIASRLLNGQPRSSVFVMLDSPSTDADGLLDALETSLVEQYQILIDFRAHTRTDRIKAVLDALHAIEPYTLFIDAIDWLDSSSGTRSLSQLIDGIAEGSQLILNGRRLPVYLLEDPYIRAQVTLTPIDESRMLVDYLQPRTGKVLLEVFALGPGRAFVNGSPILHWDGTLPRGLFMYLVDRGMVTRSAIFDAFWPGLGAREATNVFHVTKRKISELLGFDLTLYETGYYQLSPEVELCYDVVKFGEAFQTGHAASGPEAIPHLEQVVHLYRADFLSGLDQEWVRARRAELRSMYAEALSMLADLYPMVGQHDRAESAQRRALAASRNR